MSDDGKIPQLLGVGRRMLVDGREDATHGGEFLSGEATHDACLTEQSFNSRVAAGNGTGMAGCCAASAFAGTSLDGGNATSFANERSCMEQQFVRIGYVLDIKQFYRRRSLGVKVFVHILQHVLNANLLPVTDAPHRAELQSFDDCRLKDEYGRGPRTADEVNPLRMKLRDGLGENAMVPGIEHADAVGTDERTSISFTCIKDALFECGTGLSLFAKAGRDDDESANSFFGCQHIDIVGAETGCDNKDSQFGVGNVFGVVISFDALNLFFFWIHDAQLALIATANEVSDDGTARLMCVVRAADDDDALWF